MRIFHCNHCQQLIFFENVQCVKCKHLLAFLPDVLDMASLEEKSDKLWTSRIPATGGRSYRLCENYTTHNVCNWVVPAHDPHPFCVSCRLDRIIPNLGQPEAKEEWYRLEAAKRRMVYSLLDLDLPVVSKIEDPEKGLAFEFLADGPPPNGKPVLTGHDNGVITINIAEASHVERERRRVSLHEPYRTLLGHFRHEIGHYYWDRLLANSPRIDSFRQMFGDERADYGEALRIHYQNGAATDWQEHFISAYASTHPWEDWAETWAHYLHMTDTLEIAGECGLHMRPRRPDEPAFKPLGRKSFHSLTAFDRMVENWYSLTFVLNNLNRGLGLADGYPFVLSNAVVDKLRFIHETILRASVVPDVKAIA